MRSVLLLPFALSVSLLTGCGGAKDAADKQYAELEQEITRVQAEQDRMSERIGELEAKRTHGSGGTQVSDAAHPPLEVVVLKPDGSAPTPDEDTATDDGPRTTVRAVGRDDVGEARDAGKGRSAKSDARTKAEAQKEYDGALSLVKKKQYDKAIEALTGFLVRYPDDARSDNAMFWMGEAYLGKGDTSRALDEFQDVVSRFPDGNKAPDSLLKIALVNKKLGEDAKAKEALATLKSRFPSSDAARRAPKEL
jgi:tol-pal system protein YbgF